MNRVFSPRDQAHGTHSKIPSCCVQFFCEVRDTLGSAGLIAINQRRSELRKAASMSCVLSVGSGTSTGS